MTLGATARNLVAPLMRWGYRIVVHGGHRCPRRGPLLVVAPYLGFWDPTVIATCLPRPVEVLIAPGGLTAMGGRIPGRIVVPGDDPGPGLRSARGVLRSGGAVGAWSGDGRERGAALLAAASDAPILPVAVFGGSGAHPGDPPAWRSRIDVVVGEPWLLAPPADPLARADVLAVAEAIRQRVADHAAGAARRVGRLDGVGRGVGPVTAENGAS